MILGARSLATSRDDSNSALATDPSTSCEPCNLGCLHTGPATYGAFWQAWAATLVNASQRHENLVH